MSLWGARFSKEVDQTLAAFNASISVDRRMYRQDIIGSIAHVEMLGQQQIISKSEQEELAETLQQISTDVEAGILQINPEAEDIHMWVEEELTKRLGATGKRVHTARSRNDQVALDVRLYLLERLSKLKLETKQLIEVLLELSKTHLQTIMPGYTHLQRAQPITLAHHMMAYVEMLLRDLERMEEVSNRTASLPLGAGALATTTHPIDRNFVKERLGFRDLCHNSLDAVSDRDFLVETGFICSLLMMHLSRLSEEIVIWSSFEFGFISLDDAFATGSSIMPQKKNPDLCELIRGKTGRVYGNLQGLLVMLKGLSLAYNKDMQEDKEAVFDSLDTVDACLTVLAPMLATMTVNKERLYKAAKQGMMNATDCADYLVKKGLPFREAYQIVGQLVAEAGKQGLALEELSLADLQQASPLFDTDIYQALDLLTCVEQRKAVGGPAPVAVQAEIDRVEAILSENR